MTFADALPAVNASLNAASAICIFGGWRAIRAGRRTMHRNFMISAVVFSSLFLTFYLIRFALTGAHEYPVADWTRTVYFFVLISHMLLAVATPPLVIRTVYLAWKKRFAEHKRIVRWTLPIWGYVSVTGVLVYWMLYHLAPSRA